jgi:hypothetical protein
MPANLRNLYNSKGTKIKTTLIRDTLPPPPPKPQPKRAPLAAADTSEALASGYDPDLWDIGGVDGNQLLDSDDHCNDKPRRMHQVPFPYH